MKCSRVEQAVAVYSESKLVLFVRLKTTSVDSQLTSSSSSSSSHISQVSAAEPPRLVCETDNHRKHVKPAKNNDGGSDAEDRVHLTAGETERNEIQTLLKQWLSVHSQPDSIEIVDSIPFTKHGKFLL